MKNYWLYDRDFCVHAVKYFYSVDAPNRTKKAKEILGNMTQEELDKLYTLISEFNNDDFIKAV